MCCDMCGRSTPERGQHEDACRDDEGRWLGQRTERRRPQNPQQDKHTTRCFMLGPRLAAASRDDGDLASAVPNRVASRTWCSTQPSRHPRTPSMLGPQLAASTFNGDLATSSASGRRREPLCSSRVASPFESMSMRGFVLGPQLADLTATWPFSSQCGLSLFEVGGLRPTN
ncbi:hypothetical protein L226DRAFT_151677 [Lentinus tigrinus ALCF2SS1-7]|uniref:uncharacterized protein n=1 Tax=Lentinus tigrinus ALCF2SS1-7 TaxID=1328758 RepID=UPI001165F86E|nr:hypothetical protein L226DRAFT_151677 [Lentinus tigrinus ALCF2SS1-7]